MAVDTELLRQNLIYGEISGNAVVSLNYQRMLSKHYAIRVGYGAWVINDNETSGNPLAIPTSPVLLLLIQYVFDKFFEMGIGKNIRLKSDGYFF